jgi:hypothetical protein
MNPFSALAKLVDSTLYTAAAFGGALAIWAAVKFVLTGLAH